MRSITALRLNIQAVHFYNNAINFIFITIAFLLPFMAKSDDFGYIFTDFRLMPSFRHFKTQCTQIFNAFMVRVKIADHLHPLSIFGISQLIDEGFDAPSLCILGIFCSQTTSCGIAWIGEECQAIFFALFIDFFKNIFANQGFTSQFHLLNILFRKLSPQGNGTHHLGIMCHLFTNDPIPTRRGLHQNVIFIHQSNSAAIKFRFNTIFNICLNGHIR